MTQDKPPQKCLNDRLIAENQQADRSARRSYGSISVWHKNARGILRAFACSCLFLAGSVAAAEDLWDLKPIDDASQLNVSFHSAEAQYRRIEAQQSGTREGWVESGVWQAQAQSGKSQVFILVASLYDKAFTKKGIRSLRSLATTFSGSNNLAFGEQDTVASTSGDIDYVLYRASGQACVFMRKYWSDPELAADSDQLTAALGWVAGSNFIYVNYCRNGNADLQVKDMNTLFAGIEARKLYWPDDMFGEVGSIYGEDPGKGPVVATQIGGRYSSEVTATGINPGFWIKQLGSTLIILNQENSNISGTFGNAGRIWGKVVGDTISFDWFGGAGSTGVGEWKISTDGFRLQGSWTNHSRNSSGTWNLERVDGNSVRLEPENQHAPVSTPPPAFDLAGVYTSNIHRMASADYWCFNQKRNFSIELKQDKNIIKGKFLSGITGEIEGTLIKNKVRFTWYTAKCSGLSEGEWTVSSDGLSLEGFTSSDVEWKARKIQ
ncbi:MAG: hypothetical protein PVI79_18310 [Gammaproteobacteria bacterium]|jgi:hypothetical protein